MNLESLAVQMDRLTVLAKIRDNRDKHRSDYDKAMDAFKVAYRNKLLKMLEEMDVKRPMLYIDVRVPEQHLQEYDEVLEMLEMCNAQNIDLTQDQFRAYIKDEWIWKASFLNNTGSYLVH